ncbi:MAG: FkbM family methyltransferase [Acetobacteraceae bacterium]|nr:FkbM family methyltransferase [Acetobacteraceae bacterium]
MPNSLLSLIARVPGVEQLRNRLRALDARIGALEGRMGGATAGPAPEASFPLQPWWERSFWEPTVALAIRDHCRPGDTVFDVGSNAGALAMMMSRLVGPRGTVLAFEASPRIIDKTHHNLVKAGCHNVTLFHKAVWHSTGALVNMAAGSHLNDRIEEAATGMSVRTVALDDLAAAGDFRPSFIKMDIEGAEFDALRGASRLLREVRPILALEQSPEDMRCHALLTEAGYAAMDLASYRRIRSAADFPAATGVANVLFAPQERIASNPYFSEDAPAEVSHLTAGEFIRATDGSISLAEPIALPPGRYIVAADFSASGRDNDIWAGVEADGEMIFRYHTYTSFMAESYSEWVIQLDRPARISPFLRFLGGSDPSLRWNGARVRRLSAFDGWAPPVVE